MVNIYLPTQQKVVARSPKYGVSQGAYNSSESQRLHKSIAIYLFFCMQKKNVFIQAWHTVLEQSCYVRSFNINAAFICLTHVPQTSLFYFDIDHARIYIRDTCDMHILRCLAVIYCTKNTQILGAVYSALIDPIVVIGTQGLLATFFELLFAVRWPLAGFLNYLLDILA